jgi:UDP-glucuronate 4-epimerase
MKILITGCYGFLGYSLAMKCLDKGWSVIGIDRTGKNAISEKYSRIANLAGREGFTFRECDISSWLDTYQVYNQTHPDTVMHLAAMYSVPHDTDIMHNYIRSNLVGFMHVIEAAKHFKVKRFHYASSTWVDDHIMPWTMYGATKQFNEHAANIYSTQFDMETLGIRYGSAFGPFCRADVGPSIVAKRLLSGNPHDLKGSYLYKTAFLDVDDAVDVTLSLLTAPLPKKHNICTIVADDQRHNLYEILQYFAARTGVQPIYTGEYIDPGPGGVPTEKLDQLEKLIGYRPPTKVEQAAEKFIYWYNLQFRAGLV